ncbi:hypothetical protein GPECTOR_26g597 [Gonium pectorale]|uniref:Uncharacterized protein n=1 Tax=Gonium pectorale TaxID=33097 RepID=A0A150GFU8_GONPE|nr:hypothetical protein GPECTOR_26g597 [Gonium pectorale]|eukprot:KXZ48694.1 hypothetical protein GPECTOR_26g597 [Gonium pectorale]
MSRALGSSLLDLVPVAFTATVVSSPSLTEGDARLDSVSAALRNATLASTVFFKVSARRVRAPAVVAPGGFIRNCSASSSASYRSRLAGALQLSVTDVAVLCSEQPGPAANTTQVPRPPSCSPLLAALVLDTTLSLDPAANGTAVQERFAGLPGADGGLRGLCVPAAAAMPPPSTTLDIVLSMPNPVVLYSSAAAVALAAAGGGGGAGGDNDSAALLAAVTSLLAADVRLGLAVGMVVPLQQVEILSDSIKMRLPPSPPPASPPAPPAPPSPPPAPPAPPEPPPGNATASATSGGGAGTAPDTVGTFQRDREWSRPIIIALSSFAGVVVILLVLAYLRSRRIKQQAARSGRGVKSVRFGAAGGGAAAATAAAAKPEDPDGFASLAPGTGPLGPKTEELQRAMSLAPPPEAAAALMITTGGDAAPAAPAAAAKPARASGARSPGGGRGPSRLASPALTSLGNHHHISTALSSTDAPVSRMGTMSRGTPSRTSRASAPHSARAAGHAASGELLPDGPSVSDVSDGGRGGGHGAGDSRGSGGGAAAGGGVPGPALRESVSQGLLETLLESDNVRNFMSQASLARRLDSYQSVVQDESGQEVIVYERRRPPRDQRATDLGVVSPALSRAASQSRLAAPPPAGTDSPRAISPVGSFVKKPSTALGLVTSGEPSPMMPPPISPALFRIVPPLQPLASPSPTSAAADPGSPLAAASPRLQMPPPQRVPPPPRQLMSDGAEMWREGSLLIAAAGHRVSAAAARLGLAGPLSPVPAALDFDGDDDIRVEAAPRSYGNLLASSPSFVAAEGRPRSGASSRVASRAGSMTGAAAAVGRAVGRRASQVLGVDGAAVPAGAGAAGGRADDTAAWNGGARGSGEVFAEPSAGPSPLLAVTRESSLLGPRARSITIAGGMRDGAVGRVGWSPLSRGTTSVTGIGADGGEGSAGDGGGGGVDGGDGGGGGGGGGPGGLEGRARRWMPKRTQSYSRLALSSQPRVSGAGVEEGPLGDGPVEGPAAGTAAAGEPTPRPSLSGAGRSFRRRLNSKSGVSFSGSGVAPEPAAAAAAVAATATASSGGGSSVGSPTQGKASTRWGRGRVGWASRTGDGRSTDGTGEDSDDGDDGDGRSRGGAGDGVSGVGNARPAASGPASTAAAAALAESSDDELAGLAPPPPSAAPTLSRPPSRWAAAVTAAAGGGSTASFTAGMVPARNASGATATDADADGSAGPSLRLWGRSITLNTGRTFNFGGGGGGAAAAGAVAGASAASAASTAAQAGARLSSPGAAAAARVWRRTMTSVRDGFVGAGRTAVGSGSGSGSGSGIAAAAAAAGNGWRQGAVAATAAAAGGRPAPSGAGGEGSARADGQGAAGPGHQQPGGRNNPRGTPPSKPAAKPSGKPVVMPLR